MDEAWWPTSDDLRRMIDHLTYILRDYGMLGSEVERRAQPLVSHRRLRLFACACCRQVPEFLADGRCRRTVQAAEWHADSPGTVPRPYSEGVPGRVEETNDPDEGGHWLGFAGGLLACPDDDLPMFLQDTLMPALRRQGRMAEAAQAALLRDVVGTAWQRRPISSQSYHGPDGLSAIDKDWQMEFVPAVPYAPAVPGLARAAYDERRPDGTLEAERLLVLSDALEEAGADAELLLHLRSSAPHIRGCWVLDLLLGRENPRPA